eukprot:g4178.t1
MALTDEEKKEEVSTLSLSGGEEELKRLADAMLANPDVRTNESTSKSKRVKYFKGSRMVKALVADAKCPEVKTEKDALRVAAALYHGGFYFRVKKNPDKDDRRNALLPVPRGANGGRFEPKDYYVWVYEGDKKTTHLMTGVIVVCFLACCMFPIWPMWTKVALWYVSVTLLLFLLGFIFVRLIVFAVSWICGYEFWILPNVFDEELGFFDSFKPGYSFEKTPPGQMYARVGLVLVFAAFCYWVYTQPTDFDRYIHVQKSFIDDLYSGELLSDKSQEELDNLDKAKTPTVEELLAEEEAEAKAAAMSNPKANVDPNMMMDNLEGDELDAYLEKMMEDHDDNIDDGEDEDGPRHEEDEDEEYNPGQEDPI